MKSLEYLLKGVVWESLGILLMYLISKDLKVIVFYFGIRILLFVPFNHLWKKMWRKFK